MEKRKPKVAIYYRVSSNEQVDQYGIQLQQTKIKDWLKFHSDDFEFAWNEFVFNESEEIGVSGRDDFNKRPEWWRLLQLLEKSAFFWEEPPFDIVVAYKLDRFARRVRVLYDIIHQLDKYWVTLASVTENFDLRTPFGKAIVGILGVFAELERDNFMERSSAGKEEMKKDGKIQTEIFWYYKTEDNTPKIFEKEASVVKTIFEKYVLEDCSIKQICTYLEDENIPVPMYSELDKPNVRDKDTKRRKRQIISPYKWKDKTIRNILSNECYIWNYFFNKTKRDSKLNKNIRLPKEQWQKSPIGTPIIVSNELFQAAQKKLEIKSATKKKENNNQYLLSGLLFCDHCKQFRTKYDMCSWQGKPSSGKGKEIYQCYWKRSDRNEKTARCNCLPLNRIDLDKLVLFHILQLLKNPQAIENILSQEALFIRTKEKLEKDNEKIREQIAKLKEKKKKLEKSFYEDPNCDLTQESYKEYRANLDWSLQTLWDKINTNSRMMSSALNTESYLKVLNLIHNKFLKEGDALLTNICSIKKILDYIVSRIIIYSREKDDQGKIPWKKTKYWQAIPYKIRIELKLPQEFLNSFFQGYSMGDKDEDASNIPLNGNRKQAWNKMNKKNTPKLSSPHFDKKRSNWVYTGGNAYLSTFSAYYISSVKTFKKQCET